MRIFSEDKSVELTEYDLDLGYLKTDTLITHIDAVEGVEEQGHYEVIRKYPETGGEDVEWVVDVPGVKPTEEHDEIEEILVYVAYTEKELRIRSLKKERDEIEEWLKNHDYIVVKIATGRATVEEYASEIDEMVVKADRINEIDAELKALGM